ncbi:MAG: hypothetical protein COX07_03820 [Bacteroidetes bacterium CG23_combo_of_CG06-09_8_20_14_all_32_9]|nr:MAG: hypothetical protein COX07_03820 [Bacteroidetes bacterium CG23_combo_of_CG06-09_8_20_14_all_32_9]
MEYSEEKLITYLCKKVNKISETTAVAIADFYDCSIKNFFDSKKLLQFKNSKGKSKLSKEQIAEIQNIIDEYLFDKSKSVDGFWITVLIKDFVKNSISELKNTTLENLLINPFLVKAFGFDDHKEVVTFYFYQKITRSIVTSWGFTVEGLLLCSGAEKPALGGFDMKIKKKNINYQFQIKSSPNTMSIEQVRQLNSHIQNIKDKIKNIPMLGMTYGTRKQINSQIQTTLIGYPDSTLIGKELWDFIADENGYCQKVLNWIDIIMKNEPTKFSDELELKKKLLIKDWEKKYGTGRQSIEKVLLNYL